jgi:murein DD-endopeptidase
LTTICGIWLSAGPSTVNENNYLDVRAAAPPAIARIHAQPHLVYELNVTNSGSNTLTLTQVDVRRASVVLHSYVGTELLNSLAAAATPTRTPDPQKLEAGQQAIFYAWLPLSHGQIPSEIWHRISFRTEDGNDRFLDASNIRVVPDAPVELEAPLRGGPWVAIYDPELRNGHRRRVFTINGEARIPARFAVDWIKLGPDGRTGHDDPSVTANSFSYGEDVLAVADAVVAGVEDGLSEPTPNITVANEAGNYVSLDLGGSRFAFYEHLKPRSIRVTLHERVRAGQVLASVGASGSVFSGAHLHFHVADAKSPVAAEGLPFGFRKYQRLGSFPSFEALNHPWVPSTSEEQTTRFSEMPAPLTVVRFD